MNYSITFLIFLFAVINLSAAGDFKSPAAPKLFSSEQLNPYTDSANTTKLNFKSKDKTHFTFPLQAGFEFGRGNVNHKSGLDYFTEWNAFLDMNLYNKEIFLTIEAADAIVEKDWTIRPGYLSIGARFRALNENHHNIFLHAGILPGIYGSPGGYTLTVKYMYALNDFIGLSVYGRYSDWMYKNESGFSVYSGIQIITN